MQIGIVDYGLGNIASVAAAIERVGATPLLCTGADGIAAADRLILPGVGAFGDGMENLRQRGLIEPLDHFVRNCGKPILGICLGFQLLARSSEERGRHDGLGWIDAEVTRLKPSDPDLRVPHVGWDDLSVIGDCPLFTGLERSLLVYFVHSFAMKSCPHAVATCDYGGSFVAAVQKGSIYGVQFHPEKSQAQGLAILRNFVEMN
jgi:glutamine amidotransferase